MNILFVCKHNRFRSRIANSYFNKKNKIKNNSSRGVGIFSDYNSLDSDEFRICKELGIDISGKIEQITKGAVEWADKVIIVADDVDKNQIPGDKSKIEVWAVKDVDDTINNKEAIKETVREITKRVDNLLKEI
jgi:protein-tyrosine-phosphatase